MARALVQPPPAAAPSARRWARPVAIGAGALSAVLAAVAIQQGLAAGSAYQEADGMVLPDGTLQPPHTAADHQAAIEDGDAARRNAWVAGTSALVSAAAAGVCYWLGREPTRPPPP